MINFDLIIPLIYIAIYIIGCVVLFFLSTYIFHEDEGELDKDALEFSIMFSLFSWVVVIPFICSLIYMKYIAKSDIPDKIVKRLNKLYSKKNKRKE